MPAQKHYEADRYVALDFKIVTSKQTIHECLRASRHYNCLFLGKYMPCALNTALHFYVVPHLIILTESNDFEIIAFCQTKSKTYWILLFSFTTKVKDLPQQSLVFCNRSSGLEDRGDCTTRTLSDTVQYEHLGHACAVQPLAHLQSNIGE